MGSRVSGLYPIVCSVKGQYEVSPIRVLRMQLPNAIWGAVLQLPACEHKTSMVYCGAEKRSGAGSSAWGAARIVRITWQEHAYHNRPSVVD